MSPQTWKMKIYVLQNTVFCFFFTRKCLHFHTCTTSNFFSTLILYRQFDSTFCFEFDLDNVYVGKFRNASFRADFHDLNIEKDRYLKESRHKRLYEVFSKRDIDEI